MVLSFDVFSTEILLAIFKYLDVLDLCRLGRTCKRFNEIIQKWDRKLMQNKHPIVTNQTHSIISVHSYRLLTFFERVRISRNWQRGIFQDRALLYTRKKYLPTLQLEKGLLWVSRGNCIKAYRRTCNGFVTDSILTISIDQKAEISHFIKRDNIILSAHSNGNMDLKWINVNRVQNKLLLRMCHEGYIDCVDMCGNILVSGARDNHAKVWRISEDNLQVDMMEEINMHTRVWSVAIQGEDKRLLAIGSAGLLSPDPRRGLVSVFDMCSGSFLCTLSGSEDDWVRGTLHLQWQHPSILWSCGYDNCVRRWDLRTEQCEQILRDPFGSPVYRFLYDHCNTILSGTQTNGRVVLWDTRLNKYVQMYFMESCRGHGKSSPIYSLSYDAEFLFTGTEQHINVLNFSVYNGQAKDYSNLYCKSVHR